MPSLALLTIFFIFRCHIFNTTCQMHFLFWNILYISIVVNLGRGGNKTNICLKNNPNICTLSIKRRKTKRYNGKRMLDKYSPLSLRKYLHGSNLLWMKVVLFLLLNQSTYFVNETLGCCFLNVAYNFGVFKGTSLVYWYLQSTCMVFNSTFNNISVISWWLVSLVEETRVPGENHWSAASHWQALSHI